jgi:hypothetical protein
MAKALVKRFTDEHVLEQCRQRLRSDERVLVRLYMDRLDGEMWKEAAATIPADRFPVGPRPKKLKRRKLKQCIVKALARVLGEEYEDLGDWEVWRYATLAGPWKVHTFVDVGGQGHQLTYGHSIIVSERVRLYEHISLLSWLGIASTTGWEGLADSDAEPTGERLAKIVGHFIEAAPKLLESLTPD